MAEKQVYFHGTGRRKTAVAQVKLLPGEGAIIVNGTPYEDVFPLPAQRKAVLDALTVTDNLGKYSAMIKVSGGGFAGQAGAISHGMARALVAVDEKWRPVLRQYGLLTRDPRVKERKKPGLKRARKAPQYTKR
jgi:small subunit ribosomal protein S9